MPFKYAHDTDDRRAGLWEVTGRIVMETAKAFLFDDGSGAKWLPKSKVIREDGHDGVSMLSMPEWLAKEKGFV